MPTTSPLRRGPETAAFGRWLEAELNRLGWSMEELARRISALPGHQTTRASVQRWRDGAAQPGVSNAIALSQVFGIKVDNFLRQLGYLPEVIGEAIGMPPNLVPVPLMERVPPGGPEAWERAAIKRLYITPDRALTADEHFAGVIVPAEARHMVPLVVPGDVLIVDPRESIRAGRLCVTLLPDGTPRPRLSKMIKGQWWLVDNEETVPHLDSGVTDGEAVPHQGSMVLGIVIEIRRTAPGL